MATQISARDATPPFIDGRVKMRRSYRFQRRDDDAYLLNAGLIILLSPPAAWAGQQICHFDKMRYHHSPEPSASYTPFFTMHADYCHEVPFISRRAYRRIILARMIF